MTLLLVGKGVVFEGLTFKNRGHLGCRLLYDCQGDLFVAAFGIFSRILKYTHRNKQLF